MKAIYSPVVATSVIVALTGCTGMRLTNSNAFADDVYYDGSAPVRATAATASPSTATTSQDDIASYDARVSSYNAKSSNASDANRDFSQIQQYYANAGSTNGATETSTSTNKTLIASATAPDTIEVESTGGYWVDGFYGTDSDQSYAERIVKFHRPVVSVNYYSPFFTAARYSGDWNIYVDEYGSTYLVPTWTNPWYNDYYYGSGIAFDWYWGRASWHPGWWWNGWYSGWDFGWGYGGWGLAWGWPYHHHHHYGWGWGEPYHHGGHFGGPGHFDGFNCDNYRTRPVHQARSVSAPQTYSASGRTRGETVTTNPNADRAAQRYRDASSTNSRSYTRTIDGSATTNSRSSVVSSNATNTRRTTAGSAAQTNSRQSSSSTVGSNSRRTSSGTVSSSQSGTVSRSSTNSSSRSTYTPSRSSSRTSGQTNSRGTTYSQNSRRSSTSTYSPSGSSSSRSYSSGSRSSSTRGSATRSSSNTRSYSSGSSNRSFSSGGFSGGSGRSSGGFSGGGRSSGGGSHGGGGGRSR